ASYRSARRGSVYRAAASRCDESGRGRVGEHAGRKSAAPSRLRRLSARRGHEQVVARADRPRLYDVPDPRAARAVPRAYDDRLGLAEQAGREPGAARVHRAHVAVVRVAEGGRSRRARRGRDRRSVRGAPYRPGNASAVARADYRAARRAALVAHADAVPASGGQSSRRLLQALRSGRHGRGASGHHARDGQHPRSRDRAGRAAAGEARSAGQGRRRRLPRLGARDRASRADGDGAGHVRARDPGRAGRRAERSRRALQADVRSDGARVPGGPDAHHHVLDGSRSEHAHLQQHRHLRGVPSAVTPRQRSGHARPAGRDSEVSHGAFRGLHREACERAGRRRHGARSLDHRVRQQHERQQSSQQRSAAYGDPWPRARQDQGRSAPDLPAGFAIRGSAVDVAAARRHPDRVDRRQRRNVVRGLTRARSAGPEVLPMRIRQMSALVAALAMTLAGAAAAGAPLLNAAEAGDRDAVLESLEAGADPNERAPDGSTALMWAAYHGDAEVARRLIEAGADVDARNTFGAFALSEAAIIGSAPVIQVLLDAGANPNATNPEGETPLMVAARSGHVDAARLLLEAGADVNAKEQWGGQSALMWAAAQSQPEMVKLLVEHGADVDARGAVRRWERKVIKEPRPKDMNQGGFTPLLYAAREGCIECARHLIEGGADPALHDPHRVTPLVMALFNLHFDFAAYMIEADADVNKWDLYGRTPLYMAADVSTLPVMGNGAMVVIPSM